jgi:hypothetical protein
MALRAGHGKGTGCPPRIDALCRQGAGGYARRRRDMQPRASEAKPVGSRCRPNAASSMDARRSRRRPSGRPPPGSGHSRRGSRRRALRWRTPWPTGPWGFTGWRCFWPCSGVRSAERQRGIQLGCSREALLGSEGGDRRAAAKSGGGNAGGTGRVDGVRALGTGRGYGARTGWVTASESGEGSSGATRSSAGASSSPASSPARRTWRAAWGTAGRRSRSTRAP